MIQMLDGNGQILLRHFYNIVSCDNILESPEPTSPLLPLKTDTKREKLLEILREALTNTEKHKR